MNMFLLLHSFVFRKTGIMTVLAISFFFFQVSIVFATKLKSFTFLPVLKKLPTENRATVSEKRLSKLSEVSAFMQGQLVALAALPSKLEFLI